MMFAALLALVCIAAAVISIRTFVLASSNRFAGVIQPAQSISLDFSAVGHLSILTVHPGDHVRAGEILARADLVGTSAVDLAAQAANAAVLADQQDLAVAKQDFTVLPVVRLARIRRAAAQLAADQARLAEARAVLDQATIRSPASGLVVNVNGAVGDLVGPDGVQIDGSAQPPQMAQTPDVSLFPQASQHSAQTTRDGTDPLIQVAAGPTEVAAQVPESAMRQMRPGQRATVTVPALGASFAARLVRVVPDPVQVNGDVSYQVMFVLQRPSLQVLPGMSADVILPR
jgi:multidrug efflux pump subunit AcrA (membrane-fusion protein)